MPPLPPQAHVPYPWGESRGHSHHTHISSSAVGISKGLLSAPSHPGAEGLAPWRALWGRHLVGTPRLAGAMSCHARESGLPVLGLGRECPGEDALLEA